MNAEEGHALTRLLLHLDGSRPQDPRVLGDALWLAGRAGKAVGVHVDIDQEALTDVLGQVAQRHADAGYLEGSGL